MTLVFRDYLEENKNINSSNTNEVLEANVNAYQQHKVREFVSVMAC